MKFNKDELERVNIDEMTIVNLPKSFNSADEGADYLEDYTKFMSESLTEMLASMCEAMNRHLNNLGVITYQIPRENFIELFNSTDNFNKPMKLNSILAGEMQELTNIHYRNVLEISIKIEAQRLSGKPLQELSPEDIKRGEEEVTKKSLISMQNTIEQSDKADFVNKIEELLKILNE